MKKRKIQKKRLALLCTLCIGVVVLLTTITFMLIKQQTITFYINHKEATQLKNTVAYKKDIDYSIKAIQLSAKKGDKDVSEQIKVEPITINELKTYKIKYHLEEQTFIYYMKVIDKEAPVISGETSATITQGEDFNISSLNLKAIDNFDQDISGQITCEGSVDHQTAGEYTLHFTVSDSSHNTSEWQAIITVKEKVKEEIKQPVNNNTNTQVNTTSNVVSNPSDITVLINKQNKLPDGYSPSDLVSIGGNHYLRSEAASSLNQMRQDANNQGIPLNVVSSYRSQAYQTNLYNSYYAKDPVNAPYYSALPRTSEHELGLAIDVSYDYALHADLHNTALGQWLDAHAHEYGWILRYPYGKTNITGYTFEAWHYRYVGTALATQLKSSGLTMEEYY
ncbi:MAG: DUF5011 domain-containing protein [Erysipelotrichia bacterium]|nr:DUF5011 domain-containing protein [Erysipelotrichia bacterium]NCC54586.1 DUF5011 domain-containing protein [Erysipelotrichia bacterium]